MKYIAILRCDQPARWCEWHSGTTERYFSSGFLNSSKDAEDWLSKELKKYPDANINCSKTDKKYFIHTTILAIDEKQSRNYEQFIKTWIHIFGENDD